MNTNELLWQDHFDRQSGRGKYTSANNMNADSPGLPTGSVGNPLMLQQSLSPTGMAVRGSPWSGSKKSFKEWKNAHITGGSTEYGKAAQMAHIMGKVPGMAQPYLDQMERLKEEDEIQKMAEEEFRRERVASALDALRAGNGNDQLGGNPALNMLRRGKY